ncbi:MAG: TonB-dependent receptor [Ignavibacteriota bacterium]
MKKLLLIFFLIIPSGLIFSQAYSVSGVVTDSTENPLPGVNIILVGTNYGAASDINGKYELSNIKPGTYKIEFSAVGYNSFIKDDLVINDMPVVLNVTLKDKIIETGEILVTAGKYEQKLSEMPVSVVVISGRELQKNYFNIDEALRYVPGVSMSEEQISIRGSSGYSKGAGTRVLITIDGVPFYTGDTGEIIWEQIPITDIERVEVIKGPASSLYGSTAIGGVINIITKKVTKQALTSVQMYGGFYDKPAYDEWKWYKGTRTFYETAITHSNSINNFGYSFSFKKLDDDSYRKDDFKKRLLGYMKLDYNLSDVSSISLLADFLNMKRGNFLYWKNSQNVLIQNEVDQNKTVESNRLFLSLIYKQGLSENIGGEFKSSYYYSKFDGRGVELTTSKANLLRNELLMNFKLPNDITLISGVEFSSANIKSNVFSDPNFFTTAFYSQAEYKGIKNLALTVGFRYDYIKIDSLFGANAYTPRVGLNYSILKDLIWRGSFGTGFRAPTPAEVFTTSDVGVGITVKENLNLKPETSLSFETGLKYIPSRTFNFDVAVFHTNYDNFIEPQFTSASEIQFINIIKARIQGFEIVSDVSIIPDELMFSVGYTYMDAMDTQLNKPLKYRPRHLLYMNAEYKPAPFEFKVDFRFWSRVQEIDDQIVELGLVPDGELRVPVYILDLRAGYNFSISTYPLNIFVSAKNVLNYNYIEFIGNLRPIRNFSVGLNLYL